MYRLLIVDDEVYIANGIKSSADWDSLGIVSVMAVYNIRQAKDVFGKQTIDILISDIEMPQGDGFELFEWVQEFHPHTECIFLTCHADFHYVKKAMQLGGVEYLLKPVLESELAAAVQKAIGQVEMKRESLLINKAYKHYYQLCEMQQPLLVERFWLDILNQSLPSKLDVIMEHARKQHIPYTESMKFTSVLMNVQRWHKTLTPRDEKLMEYAIRNVLDELIIKYATTSQVVQVKEGLLILTPVDELSSDHPIPTRQQLKEYCGSLIELCNRHFYCHLSCYIGIPVQLHEMLEMFQKLKTLQKK